MATQSHASLTNHSRISGPVIGIAAALVACYIAVSFCRTVVEGSDYRTGLGITLVLLICVVGMFAVIGAIRHISSDKYANRLLGHHPGESSLHWDWRWLAAGLVFGGIFSPIFLWMKLAVLW